MSFTVVVVLHDSADDLRRLLASIDRHLPQRPHVVCVDSGSNDDGPELAADWGAELLVLAGNRGFGAANNAGLARVRTDVTVLLNPDVELLDDGLARLAATAAEGDRLLAPRLLNPDGSLQRSAHPRPGTVEALLPALVHPRLLPRPLRERADPWRSDRPRRVGWAIAAALAARTETLRALGPFDPDAFLFYEDMDLCLRAAARGVPTELRPEVALRHRGGHSTTAHFGREPLLLHARRRREVVGADLGPRALALDDAAQALTFAVRALVKGPRGGRRERAQLAALRAARRG
ncbi:MAG: glycosyltransferase [Solirubrobacteraceae bacterium]|nr:glycosyltransferase [Solirubrobacteraceae bacterium]